MKYLKKIFIACVINLFLCLSVSAKSYVSESYIPLNTSVMHTTEEFEIYLEFKPLSYATEKELGMLSGYSKRASKEMYYFHYIVYYYDQNYNEIGSVDGYNGMWHQTNQSGTGTFIGQVVSIDNLYENESLSDIVYYKLFVEKSSKKIAEAFLYRGEKNNKNGLDEILDKNVTQVKPNIIKQNVINDNNTDNIANVESTNNGETIISNYSINIKVENNKKFHVDEFIRISNKKQGGAITRTIKFNAEELCEKIISIDNFYSEGNITNKSYETMNQIIINEDSASFGYDIAFESDNNNESDIIKYDLSGNIDISIEKVSFQIELPNEFDDSIVRLTNGNNEVISNEVYSYKKNENMIIINYLSQINPGEKIIFELVLPDGYFEKENSIIVIAILSVGIILSLCILIALVVIRKKKESVLVG